MISETEQKVAPDCCNCHGLVILFQFILMLWLICLTIFFYSKKDEAKQVGDYAHDYIFNDIKPQLINHQHDLWVCEQHIKDLENENRK